MNYGHVVIVGGGITGLAAAYRLHKLQPAVAITLIERDARLGGKILTERTAGFLIEGGPDSFLSRKTPAVALCAELGLTSELIGRDPRNAHTFVKFGGQLHPLPAGLSGMIPTNLEALTNNPLLSAAGKARLGQETELPALAGEADESVGSFLIRRLGQEAYERLVEPLMSGIYAGDGRQLSLAATFPQLRQLEKKHGSLLRGLQSNDFGVRSAESGSLPPFVALAGGMDRLITRLYEEMQNIRIVSDSSVETIRQAGQGRYAVRTSDGVTQVADAVIVTTPACVTAQLVAELSPELAEIHAAIPYASVATVSLAYASNQLPKPLNGYGYLIPAAAQQAVLACTWMSSKWLGRAPADQTLIRLYLGRYQQDAIAQADEEEILRIVCNELRETLGISARPMLQRIYRWPRSMPQYNLGHLHRLAQIEQLLPHTPGLFLAGAAYRGIGIPDCIQAGEQAARSAIAYLLPE